MSVKESLGEFKRTDDHIDVRFERHYQRSVETVWSALTEPTRLADWMGVSYVEPRVGGRFEVMVDGPYPMTGHIREWDPPHVLEFTWSNTHAPNSVVRYQLERAEGGTRLIFTHHGVPYANSALMLSGWHIYLTKLGRLLVGTATSIDRNGWRKMQAIYVDHYRLDLALDP